MMKAISLHQPFASAMAAGIKKCETRTRALRYRGDLVICSALLKPGKQDVPLALALGDYAKLPLGFALAVVEIWGAIDTNHLPLLPMKIDSAEILWGNYSRNRWVWFTRNLRVLKEPVRVKGRQFIWHLSPDEEKLVRQTGFVT